MSRPRRSSLKCLPESVECENSVLEKTFPRRVSFANVISICGTTEGITQLPLSKCSEESNESTKRTTFTSIVPSDATSCDVSMTICSDTSMQDSPLCKETANTTKLSLPPSNINKLSSFMDVSISDASVYAPSEGPNFSPALKALLVNEVQHCEDIEDSSMKIPTDASNLQASDTSMAIHDSDMCVDDMVKKSYDSCAYTPKAGITATDNWLLSVNHQSTQSSHIESVLQPGAKVNTPCIDAPQTRTAVNPTISQTPNILTSIIQVTPIQQPISAASDIHSSQALIFSIPPLKSDPCLWNSAPESRRRRRITQSASRWDDYNKKTLYTTSKVAKLDHDHHNGNDGNNLVGSHSLSLNNTPIRRIKPLLNWSEAVNKRKYNKPVSPLQAELYDSAHFRGELATLTGVLKAHTRLIPAGAATESVTTKLSALLDLKNLPLPADAVDLEDLCGPPPSVTELDGILEKQSEHHMCTVGSTQAWWTKSFNLNSLADTLLNSNRLLLYGKLCLDRQKAVLDTCPSAKLTENVDAVHCYCAAVETLYRCHSEAKQELQQLIKERHKTRHSHNQCQVNFLREVNCQLTEECAQLQNELDALNSEIANWEGFEMEEKENISDVTLDEDLQLAEVTEQLNQVDLKLREGKAEYAAEHWKILRQQPTLCLSSAVGCTELFVSTRSFVTTVQHPPLESSCLVESEELINLLCPGRLHCLDYAKHKYQYFCLLGHVAFVFDCCVHLLPPGEQRSSCAISNSYHAVEDLLIQTVTVEVPDAALLPVDCPAVERLAQYSVDFFNSAHKSASQLRSRLVGMSLAEAVDYLEFVVLPYLVTACDLRSIYMKGHSVEFSVLELDHGHKTLTSSNCSSNNLGSVAETTSTLSSLLSTAPFQLPPEQLSGYLYLQQVTPPWPLMVTVQLGHLPTRSVLSVSFTFDRLEFHRSVPYSISIDVLVGQFDSQVIRSVLNKEEIKLGQLHKIVSLIEAYLSSTQSSV